MFFFRHTIDTEDRHDDLCKGSQAIVHIFQPELNLGYAATCPYILLNCRSRRPTILPRMPREVLILWAPRPERAVGIGNSSGLTARMWRARLLTFSVVAADIADRIVRQQSDHEDLRLTARLAFERLFVSALVRAEREDPEHYSGVARHVPGSRTAAEPWITMTTPHQAELHQGQSSTAHRESWLAWPVTSI